MKIKLLFVLCFCVLMSRVSEAQVSAYSFTQAFTQYGSPLTGTNYFGSYNQGYEVNTIPLPFSFTYNGLPYSSIDAASNGFLTFATASGFETDPITDPTTAEVLSPLGTTLVAGMAMTGNIANGSNVITAASFANFVSVGDSLEDFFGDFALPFPKVVSVGGGNITLNCNALVTASAYDFYMPNGAIRSQVAGTTPNRTVTIEYRNFCREQFNEAFNFKVRLHETINKIEFCYGSAQPGTLVATAEIGLKGSSTSDFNIRKVASSNVYIASQTGTLVTDNCLLSNSKYPTGGVTYGWQPPCPVPTFTVAQSTASTCTGGSVTLTASGATNYYFVGIGSQTTAVVSPTVTTTYTVVGLIGLCMSTVHVLQTVDVTPTITINTPTNGVCSGNSATLTATGANSYTWTNFGNNAQIVVTPTATTIYTVTGKNGVCSSQNTKTITVAALPNVQIARPSATSCIGQPVTLTASGATTYTWSTGAKTAAITVTLSVATDYTVTGTFGGCSKEMVITQYVKVCDIGIGENSLGNISVFPNPFASQIAVRNDNGIPVTITINDITGKVIYRKSVEKDLVIDTESWSSGIYLMSVSGGDRTAVRKIVKQ